MIAAGIDLGGTKVETQLFDEHWQCADSIRDTTPSDYGQLLQTIAKQIAWAQNRAGKSGLPIGLGSAGRIEPSSGVALTANLPVSGHNFLADIKTIAGYKLSFINDGHATALSEAIFGSGKGYRLVVALVLGTGVGGGAVFNGVLLQNQLGGEFGHIPLPAQLVSSYQLPLIECGCGRKGCYETLISGQGIARLAKHTTTLSVSAEEMGDPTKTDNQFAEAWMIWSQLVAELLKTLALTLDPDCILLAGGLSQVKGIVDIMTEALTHSQLPRFGIPHIALAQGGPSSGARGAAYAAYTSVYSEDRSYG